MDIIKKEWMVGEDHIGQRLDKALVHFFENRSRSQMQEWIHKGWVKVRGIVRGPAYTLKAGDAVVVDIPVISPPECILTPECMDLNILYEDDSMLVIDKPPGLVVHPGPGHTNHTLVHGLLAHCNLSTVSGKEKPGIVHRLDKDTSGLIVIAKTDVAHYHLGAQFEKRTMTKRYWAWVKGHPQPCQGTIENYIKRHPVHRQKMAVSAEGRWAKTSYRVLGTAFLEKKPIAWIEYTLWTGRTHQLRVHAQHMKHSILGDTVYGDGAGHTRQALHACYVKLQHPSTHKEMCFTSPVPQDLHFLAAFFSPCLQYHSRTV